MTDKANPRFVVSSLPKADWPGKALYEELYCARGEMENRIKEQLGLFADQADTSANSAHRMRVNQMRLWLSSLAYVLLARFRKWGLRGTEWARTQIWKQTDPSVTSEAPEDRGAGKGERAPSVF